MRFTNKDTKYGYFFPFFSEDIFHKAEYQFIEILSSKND